MTAFNPGDWVLFTNGDTIHVAIVRGETQMACGYGYGYAIDVVGGGSWNAYLRVLSPLPKASPRFNRGDLVWVCADAPYHAGLVGTVSEPETHGDLPGYWLNVADLHSRVWVPAAALTPRGGEQR